MMNKLLILSLTLLAGLSFAQTTLFEQEPNNDPHTVNQINAPVIILGEMQNSDQDMFVWEVTDVDAGYFWDLKFKGIADKLTKMDVMQLTFTEDGSGVTKVDELFSIKNPNGAEMAQSGLIFSPGRYYFGLSYAGGQNTTKSPLLGDTMLSDLGADFVAENEAIDAIKIKPQNSYQIDISQGKKQHILTPKDNSQDNPESLKKGLQRGLFFEQQKQWITFNIDAAESEQVWKIDGAVNIGEKLQLNLFNAQGQKIATTQSNALGRFNLANLKLPVGDYLIGLSSQTNALSRLEIFSEGEYIAGHEAEPNDDFSTANHFSIEQSVQATIGKDKDKDYFKFEIDEAKISSHYELKLSNLKQSKIQLCLYTSNRHKLQCKTSHQDIVLSQLSLSAGEYMVAVTDGELDNQYVLALINTGPQANMMEAEPNDDFSEAKFMGQKRIVKGRFNEKETDYFVFEVNQEDQVWTIQAIGEAINGLALYNAANQNVQSVRFNRGTKRARLAQLNLQPGKHYVELKGENSAYILRAFPTGPVDQSFETEPNDDLASSQPMEFNQAKRGLLQSNEDVDVYRFHLNNEQGINLNIRPAQDADISYKLYWENMLIGHKNGQIGETLKFQGTLPAGSYRVELKAGKNPSGDIYHLEINLLNLADCQHDCEPNDSAHQANVINPSILVAGETATHGDDDWYQIPAFATETTVTFQSDTADIKHELNGFINYDQKLTPELNPDKNQLSFVVPANQASYYKIDQRAANYDYRVLINHQEIETPKQYNNIQLSINNVPKKLQAYSPYAQLIEAQLTVKNSGSEAQQLTLIAEVNDYRWKIGLADNTAEFNVNANETTSIPVVIHVPNELIRRELTRLSFTVSNKQGFVAQTWHDVMVDDGVPLLKPYQYWSVAEELLGGLNVAATAMGAERTAEDIKFNTSANGSGFDNLFDGIAASGLGLVYRGGRAADEDHVTIELAGDTVVPVQGILLSQLSNNDASGNLKDFDLQLSIDGVNFKSVLTGQLKTVKAEQSFVLPQVVPAKYARLYLLNSYHDVAKPRTSLDEWKVIASPKHNINSGHGFNIADPSLGGYVAWAIPETSRYWDKDLLTEKQDNHSIRSKSKDDWQWVVGFHDQRAAKIDKIQWQHPTFSSESIAAIKQVKIMTSLDSNVGPWKLVAEKEFNNLQSMDDIVFDQPVWARYIKFVVANSNPSQSTYLPNTIRIFEHPHGQDYQSILAEWGVLSMGAIYEKTHKKPIHQPQTDLNLNNHSQATAIDLTTKQTVSGQVQLEETDKKDWYKYQTKADDNTLTINLSGQQTVETVIEVVDETGHQLPLLDQLKKTNHIEYKIPVEPNKTYYIKVAEPPRSVIFVWDTSGSTHSYKPLIYSAINSYSNDVVEGRDMVNFLPFGGQPLMKDWYGKPYYIKTILNNYPQNHNSSHAESALYKATKALEGRVGSKAIIVITDAITSKEVKVWQAFKQVKPRIFSIGIIQNDFGGAPAQQIDLMQSWSQVNNGDFQQVFNAKAVENAFDRAAVKLRQPADYTLKVSSEYIKAPGPGQLIISQENSNQAAAVELILDASGSMLQRLDGKRRITIAKEVLIDTVTQIIPEKTPVALRVFGDKQANACRTDLAIKLEPLDSQKAKNIISNINAKNLAKTPIADSLAKVATDLKSHQGKKIVILVTDGEETCDGNPEEVIDKLIEQGIDVRLNIVGFAIDDEELKAQFNQWSNQGGGQYFDSNNSESLKKSISQALKTPFSIFSLSGELIKEGVVNGEALELPAGIYQIKIYGSEMKVIENYHIKGEVTQEIDLSKL